ncbi:MAG: hypothetical protein H6948_02320 [Zoogloeaceae bacterium]|nr:hypothetical protein [Zoogloeaceae bacterium]
MHRHNGTDYQHANDCPHCWREASDIQSEVIERLSTKLAAEREAREKANHDLTEREHEIERLTRERATEAWRAEKAERERDEALHRYAQLVQTGDYPAEMKRLQTDCASLTGERNEARAELARVLATPPEIALQDELKKHDCGCGISGCRNMLRECTTCANMRLTEELVRVREKLLRDDDPWPLSEVLRQLSEAAWHLMQGHGCDCDGHEQTTAAMLAAAEIRNAVEEWKRGALGEG